MNLTNHQKCRHRDSALLSLLEKCEVLDTEQIKHLFFHNVSLRMTQKRLSRLVEMKRLKRDRLSVDLPYYYYQGKPGQVEHRIGVNWIYTWKRLTLHSWEKFHSFEWEVTFSNMRSDGLVSIKNLAYNALQFSFAEFNIEESWNQFDKVSKYNTLYESKEWLNTWWGSLAVGFPSIIVVTTGKIEKIQKLINKENRNGLEFILFTLDMIKGECKSGNSSSASIRT